MIEVPNTICIDFHGVLTNGKINIAADGTTSYETVCVKDIAAIRELIARGFEVYIVTSSVSRIIDAYAKKVGCIKIQSRVKDDLFAGKKYLAIGDSSFDYKFLRNAVVGFCPSDAEDVLLTDPKIIKLKTRGGDGCIYELLSLITHLV